MDRAEIKDVFIEALKEHHTEFYVDAEKHYNDHKLIEVCQKSRPEWAENHKFVSEVRKNGKTAKGVGLKLMITALFGYLITIFIRGWG